MSTKEVTNVYTIEVVNVTPLLKRLFGYLPVYEITISNHKGNEVVLKSWELMHISKNNLHKF